MSLALINISYDLKNKLKREMYNNASRCLEDVSPPEEMWDLNRKLSSINIAMNDRYHD